MSWFYLLVTSKSFFICIDTQAPFASQIRFEKLLLYIYPKVLKKQVEKIESPTIDNIIKKYLIIIQIC